MGWRFAAGWPKGVAASMSPIAFANNREVGMWTQAKDPLGYRCQDCDTDLPATGADADLTVLTCPACGSACDLEGSAARRGNARPAKTVISTGMRAVMFPFT
jgi:DNA-directed RNA polymerase subunit RPC12/RpoP